MNKKLLYILIVAAILGLVISVTGAFFNLTHIAKEHSSGNSNPFGFLNGQTGTTTVTTPSGPSDTRSITTTSGTVINVPNFTEGKSSQQVSGAVGDVQYDLTPYPDYVAGQPYPDHAFDVAFDQKTSKFIVTLDEEPLGSSRTAAENYLRSTLQLSDQQLCSLNTVVGVPYAVNPQYSAINVGLSFCPGAVPLP